MGEAAETWLLAAYVAAVGVGVGVRVRLCEQGRPLMDA